VADSLKPFSNTVRLPTGSTPALQYGTLWLFLIADSYLCHR